MPSSCCCVYKRQRLGRLGVLAAERFAVVRVRPLPGQRHVAADRLRRQAERLEDDLGQFLAVQGPGHRPPDPLVGQRAGGPVQGELGVGRLQGLADREAAQGRLLVGIPAGRVARPGRGGAARALRVLRLTAGQGDPVRGGPVDVRHVDRAGGQRRHALGPRHGGEDQGVELGGPAPPACVAGQRGGTGLLVDDSEAEGAGGDLEGAAGALVEGARGTGDLLGVERGEQGAPVRVRPGEGDLDLQVALAPLDLLDPLVAGVARGPVRRVLAVQGPPLGHEVGGADLAAVAPHRLLVQLVQDDLLGLPLDDLGLFQVVRIGHRPALVVQREQLGQHRPGDPGGGGVGIGLEGVQGLREAVHGPAQHTAVGDLVAGRHRDVLAGGHGAALVVAGAAAREQRQCEDSRGQQRQGPAPSLGHGCYLRAGREGHEGREKAGGLITFGGIWS